MNQINYVALTLGYLYFSKLVESEIIKSNNHIIGGKNKINMKEEDISFVNLGKFMLKTVLKEFILFENKI